MATTSLRGDVDEIIRIVTGLLQLARGDRQPPGLELKPLNLARVLREAASQIAPLLEAEGRTLEVSAPDSLLIGGDAGLWRDYLGALLENARVHGAGRVRATLAPVDDTEIVLTVSDEGQGVPPMLREQVFERSTSSMALPRAQGPGLRSSAKASSGMAAACASVTTRRLSCGFQPEAAVMSPDASDEGARRPHAAPFRYAFTVLPRRVCAKSLRPARLDKPFLCEGEGGAA